MEKISNLDENGNKRQSEESAQHPQLSSTVLLPSSGSIVISATSRKDSSQEQNSPQSVSTIQYQKQQNCELSQHEDDNENASTRSGNRKNMIIKNNKHVVTKVSTAPILITEGKTNIYSHLIGDKNIEKSQVMPPDVTKLSTIDTIQVSGRHNHYCDSGAGAGNYRSDNNNNNRNNDGIHRGWGDDDDNDDGGGGGGDDDDDDDDSGEVEVVAFITHKEDPYKPGSNYLHHINGSMPEADEYVNNRSPSNTYVSPSRHYLQRQTTLRGQRALHTWCQRYNELYDYKTEHGDTNVPQKWAHNKKLGIWVNKQRCQYELYKRREEKTSMTKEKVRQLDRINFIWSTPKGEDAWLHRYKELELYYRQHGDCNVPTKYKVNPALGRWISTQRSQYRSFLQGSNDNKLLNRKRVDMLNKLGFAWNLEGFDIPKNPNNNNNIIPRMEHHFYAKASVEMRRRRIDQKRIFESIKNDIINDIQESKKTKVTTATVATLSSSCGGSNITGASPTDTARSLQQHHQQHQQQQQQISSFPKKTDSKHGDYILYNEQDDNYYVYVHNQYVGYFNLKSNAILAQTVVQKCLNHSSDSHADGYAAPLDYTFTFGTAVEAALEAVIASVDKELDEINEDHHTANDEVKSA